MILVDEFYVFYVFPDLQNLAFFRKRTLEQYFKSKVTPRIPILAFFAV